MTKRAQALPLEGGGLGGGGGSISVGLQGDVSPPDIAPTAHTPIPGPSPLEGEGRAFRFTAGHRYSKRAGGAAKRMRRELTLGERKLWAELRKLPFHIRRQVPIGPYVADFAILRSRLVIEVDGASHTGEAGELRDALRDAFLRSQGFDVLRLRDADVIADPAACARAVHHHVPA